MTTVDPCNATPSLLERETLVSWAAQITGTVSVHNMTSFEFKHARVSVGRTARRRTSAVPSKLAAGPGFSRSLLP